jgi:hypothetical protein
MQKPITSRVKRSPLLKYSPAKETKDGNVEAIGSKTTKGKDKKVEVTETKKKDYVGAANDACSAEYIAKNGRAKCDEYEALPQSVKDAANTETITTTKIEPGEDKTVDTKLYRKDYQDVKEPWEVRRSNRSAKIAGRSQRRAQNKADKVARQLSKLSDDEKKPGNKKYDRLMAKQTETTQELDNMKQGSTNVAESRKSGKLAGSRVRRTEDVVKTAGDYEDPEQIKQAARRQEIAEQSGMTTSQAEGAPMPGQTAFSGALESAKELGELDYEAGQYTQGITMKPSAFKMKGKSPATKKLQGNQGKLPQHLQDAIKAAPESPAKLGPLAAIAGKALIGALASKAVSSNKMRSGFKMKGYGKK